MALFRKRETQVIKRSTTETVETRKVRRIGGQKVEVKRVETKAPPPTDNGATKQKPKQKHRDDRRQGGQRN
ncbi:MAG: hypothetical protein R3246_14650, partial [Acidimicrobiia bacterium]|nr:hypothetical protein [Acidimicrobiia bacterium]